MGGGISDEGSSGPTMLTGTPPDKIEKKSNIRAGRGV
jgi:hypothetical protein